MGRKELGYNETEIWESTPRKFFAILNCALEYKSMQSRKTEKQQKTQVGYIDQIKGW